MEQNHIQLQAHKYRPSCKKKKSKAIIVTGIEGP
jgi:hypothetical protein